MRSRLAMLVLAALIALGCARHPDVEKIPAGTSVRIERHNGAAVIGRLVEVRPDAVVIEGPDRTRARIDRRGIASVEVLGAVNLPAQPSGGPSGLSGTDESRGSGHAAGRSGSAPSAGDATQEVEYREVTIPAGTVLPMVLETAIASDLNRLEDPVRARISRPIVIAGVAAIPKDSIVRGSVVSVKRSGKVKGRAEVAVRFDRLAPAGGDAAYEIRTATVARRAPGTKKDDVGKIAIPTAGGAVVGGLIGGKKGAAIGSAVGGATGTTMVLTTRGKEVRLNAGTPMSVRLLQPITLRVPIRRP